MSLFSHHFLFIVYHFLFYFNVFSEEKTLETDDFDETLTEEYIIDEDVTFEEYVLIITVSVCFKKERNQALITQIYKCYFQTRCESNPCS